MAQRKLNRRQMAIQLTALCTTWYALARPKPANARETLKPEQRILILGDSMSSEYGLKRGTGWVQLLIKKLNQAPRATQVINASVSGETTAGGRSRLSALLQQHQPTHLVLELGGNDALRGLSLDMTQANLRAMAQSAKAAGAKVVLVGIQIPPNYGRAYSEGFAQLFGKVAKAENLPLVPFLLKDVADSPEAREFFQADNIHPNERAQPQILNNIWAVLKEML
ncbi:MAG: arylesterase [Burkholderiales bacterium]|jgi:acyl-CoA thioesterase-1